MDGPHMWICSLPRCLGQHHKSAKKVEVARAARGSINTCVRWQPQGQGVCELRYYDQTPRTTNPTCASRCTPTPAKPHTTLHHVSPAMWLAKQRTASSSVSPPLNKERARTAQHKTLQLNRTTTMLQGSIPTAIRQQACARTNYQSECLQNT